MPGGMPNGFHAGGMPRGFHGGTPMDARRAEEIFAQFFSGGEDPFAEMMGGGGMGGGGRGVRMRMGPGMPAGMMFGGGGMPGGLGGMFGGMGVPGVGMKRPASPQRPVARYDALRPGTRVTLFGLVKAPHLNGDSATVKDFDSVKGRYVVGLDESGETLALRPDNVQQLLPGVILQGLDSEPDLNGKSGTLLKYDALKDRYAVRLAAVRRTLSVKADNVKLPKGSVVTIRGVVAKPALNGRRGTVAGFDAEGGRYLVQTSKDEQLKLKPQNVVA